MRPMAAWCRRSPRAPMSSCSMPAIRQALAEAGLGFDAIDAVAATAGPGLIGGLIVGVTTGKAIALGLGRPFIAVNHLEAHALTAGLTDGLDFPYLLLLVSGGHTQLLIVKGVGALRAARHDARRCAGRGLRQGRQAARAWLSRRPRGRASRRARGRPTITLPRPMLGRRGAAFLSGRTQDRAPARGAGASAAERAGHRRSLRELSGGGCRHRQRPDGARASIFIGSGSAAGRSACWWSPAASPPISD